MVVAAKGVKGRPRLLGAPPGVAALGSGGYSRAATEGGGRRPAAGLGTSVGYDCHLMNPVHWLIDTVLELYIWLIIASVILSWLVAFNVINTRNSFVNQVGEFLYRVTEPALRPIRNLLPSLGGIDISPMILILLLIFARRLLWQMFA
jgi:YggT family protein